MTKPVDSLWKTCALRCYRSLVSVRVASAYSAPLRAGLSFGRSPRCPEIMSPSVLVPAAVDMSVISRPQPRGLSRGLGPLRAWGMSRTLAPLSPGSGVFLFCVDQRMNGPTGTIALLVVGQAEGATLAA